MRTRSCLAALAVFLSAIAPLATADETAAAKALYTVLFELAGESSPPDPGLAAPLTDLAKARFSSFTRRGAGFRSLLPAPPRKEGPERALALNRRQVERGIVALIDAPGIEGAASRYAAAAPLSYEWEGMSNGPRSEAAGAETFLAQDPATPLRCAFEAAKLEKNASAAAEAASKYSRWIEAALDESDPLVVIIAREIDSRPYVYLDGSPHPVRTALPPPWTIREALDRTDQYVAVHAADFADQELRSAVLTYDAQRKVQYWYLQWQWKQPRLGSEAFVKVFGDGTVEAGRLGP
jgi:hypothetical protein